MKGLFLLFAIAISLCCASVVTVHSVDPHHVAAAHGAVPAAHVSTAGAHPDAHHAEEVHHEEEDAHHEEEVAQHEPTKGDEVRLATEQGKALWESDSGVVRDRTKTYPKLKADEWVFDDVEDAPKRVANGEHLVHTTAFKTEVAMRALRDNPILANMLRRLTIEQRKEFKAAAFDAVSDVLDKTDKEAVTKKGIDRLASASASHIRKVLTAMFEHFHHENVYQQYNKTLTAQAQYHPAPEDKVDPLEGVDGVSDSESVIQRAAEAAAADPASPATSHVLLNAAHAARAARLTLLGGNPAETDPVFNPPKKPSFGDEAVSSVPLGPLHRTLGLVEDPVPMKRSAAKKPYPSAAVVGLHKLAKKVDKAVRRYHAAVAAASGAYGPMASVLAARTAAARAAAVAQAQAAGYAAAMSGISPWHALAAKQAVAHARSVAKLYKLQAKEYAKTIKYWTRQQKAVIRLRKAFVRMYNRFVSKIRARRSGDSAYKAALIDLTGRLSVALGVPTKGARF